MPCKKEHQAALTGPLLNRSGSVRLHGRKAGLMPAEGVIKHAACFTCDEGGYCESKGQGLHEVGRKRRRGGTES